MGRRNARRRAPAGLAAVLIMLAVLFSASAATAAPLAYAPTHGTPSTAVVVSGSSHADRTHATPKPTPRSHPTLSTEDRPYPPHLPPPSSANQTAPVTTAPTSSPAKQSTATGANSGGANRTGSSPTGTNPGGTNAGEPTSDMEAAGANLITTGATSSPGNVGSPQSSPPASASNASAGQSGATPASNGADSTAGQPNQAPAAANPSPSWPLTDTAVLVALVIGLAIAIGVIVFIAGYRGRSH